MEVAITAIVGVVTIGAYVILDTGEKTVREGIPFQ
jgi:hypothetical protein